MVGRFIIGLLAVFPARVAYRWLAPPQLAMTGIEGSVWRGGAAAAAGKEEFELFFKNRVAGPATHAEFIDANGGAGKIIEIRRRTS